MALAEKDLERWQANPVPDTQPMETEQEIDLIELFYKLLENFLYIALTAVLFALIAGVYSFFIATPKYQAVAKLYVVNSKDSALNLSDLQIGSYLTSDYQEVFRTWEVHEMVIQELGLDYSYGALSGMLAISNPSGTRILNITVTSDDPAEATNIANAYANVSKKYISQTMATDEPNVLSVALEPIAPVSPNKTQNILIGFLLGAFLSVGIITLRFVMDDKIKTADDIQRFTSLATLAAIPVMESSGANIKNVTKRNKEKIKQR